MKKSIRLFLPILVLAFLGIFLARGLWLDPKKLPSVFINKPLPEFSLPLLNAQTGQQEDNLGKQHFAGKPWVLNVFASWCQACLVEHPVFLKLARLNQIELVGMAYKDADQDTLNWLARHGNPYNKVLVDSSGRAGIEFGVYGVPETFVLDANGVVVYKHVGPIDDQFFAAHLEPLLRTGGIKP